MNNINDDDDDDDDKQRVLILSLWHFTILKILKFIICQMIIKR